VRRAGRDREKKGEKVGDRDREEEERDGEKRGESDRRGKEE
jgi:hypothetical protein